MWAKRAIASDAVAEDEEEAEPIAIGQQAFRCSVHRSVLVPGFVSVGPTTVVPEMVSDPHRRSPSAKRTA